MNGIAGKPAEGADAIVMSGGYDDTDLGDEIIYTGEGGQDPNGTPIANQEMVGGNAALVTSHLEGHPVRVIRGSRLKSDFAPPTGYRYDGLFYVDDYWPEIGGHGFLRWKYRLSRASDDGGSLLPPPPPPPEAAPRVPTTIQRIVRSTAGAQTVKALHDHECQVCGQTVIPAEGRRYSEAAHIRPLGYPHDGPDDPGNVLCLCPNDHVRFDHGAIVIDAGGTILDLVSDGQIGPLRTRPGHSIDPAHLAYHRALWQLPAS
jgi:putative restriction endonuclease